MITIAASDVPVAWRSPKPQPQHEQRHDDDPAADAEEPAEQPRQRSRSPRALSVRRDGMRGILEAMSAAATLAEALAPLRADPARAAILLDIDGTLAPIVRHADDAARPRADARAAHRRRQALRASSAASAAARSPIARRIVSLGSIAYVGNHGSELLRAGRHARSRSTPRSPRTSRAVRDFAERRPTRRELQRLRVRAEDKQAIAAFHWRGAPDEDAAEDAVRDDRRARARPRACASTGGARCSRCARRSTIDKGRGVRRLLDGRDLAAGALRRRRHDRPRRVRRPARARRGGRARRRGLRRRALRRDAAASSSRPPTCSSTGPPACASC